MNEMNITSAQYITDINGETSMIKVVMNDETIWVPNNASNNRHYAEILRQVDAGTLTIQEAE